MKADIKTKKKRIGLRVESGTTNSKVEAYFRFDGG